MALLKYGGGIVEITGTFAGQHFKRDRSGHHCSCMQRRVRQQTAAQLNQRNAFARARAFSTDNRVVSYNIYRALNGLPMQMPPADYTIPKM